MIFGINNIIESKFSNIVSNWTTSDYFVRNHSFVKLAESDRNSRAVECRS